MVSFGSSPSSNAQTSPVAGSVPSFVGASHNGTSVGGSPGVGGVRGCHATLRTVPSPPPVSSTEYVMVTVSPAASAPDQDRNESGRKPTAPASEPPTVATASAL